MENINNNPNNNYLTRSSIIANRNEFHISKPSALNTLKTAISNMDGESKKEMALLAESLCISLRDEFHANNGYFVSNTNTNIKLSTSEIACKLQKLGLTDIENCAKALIFFCTHESPKKAQLGIA